MLLSGTVTRRGMSRDRGRGRAAEPHHLNKPRGRTQAGTGVGSCGPWKISTSCTHTNAATGSFSDEDGSMIQSDWQRHRTFTRVPATLLGASGLSPPWVRGGDPHPGPVPPTATCPLDVGLPSPALSPGETWPWAAPCRNFNERRLRGPSCPPC